MDNMPENLKAIMKLKSKFEKDLRRKGINIESKKQKTVERANIEIKYISVPIDDVQTIVDLNYYDFKNNNLELARHIEKLLANKPKNSYINQLAVVHLLREEYEEVKELLDNPSFPEDYFNLGMAKMMLHEKDAYEFAEDAVKRFPNNKYTNLLLAMNAVYNGDYFKAYKAVEEAARGSNDPLLHFILSLYDKDYIKAKEYLSKVFLQGKVKYVASIYQGYLHFLSQEGDKLYQMRKNFENDIPCSNCLLRYSKLKSNVPPDYCKFWKVLESFEYETAGRFETEMKLPEQSIISFLGFYNYNNEEKANKSFEEISDMFGEVRVVFFPNDSHVKGLKTFTMEPIKNGKIAKLFGPGVYQKIKNVIQRLESKEGVRYDFALDLPFYEGIRMLFGWRTCQLYFTGEDSNE
ncbi:hypothetical protein SAMN02745164_00997 [Marinitoga hydrogenitolerans DSM 16785]|uniref:Tetratricopeptide repeat protein n=1 Tax=Marinitoga hydrogenitolerans (strain DSM 16785 / JCM 12826 / AT1271) TaxID=1122195 RepID=A0A1M4VRN1_MARH1|nr:hypothetical protein [Marinitoga hydrogenitolerans]SHE71578.1 hypothetical protein SAMN02745164_00997 [Marinitoga hydrogenitolerans DSM 16785]